MATFAELLVTYTKRTGVSDAELARAIGVRRQTIFRWKEGLVERPRRRDEVLRCASKLRLSAAECDALLLSAGFSPVSPEVTTRALPFGSLPSIPEQTIAAKTPRAQSTDPQRGETSAQVLNPEAANPEPAVMAAVPTGEGNRLRTPRITRPVAASVTALLILLAVTVIAVVLSGQAADRVYPAATPGELLIVVGSPEPTNAAAPASRDPGVTLSERFRSAIEREVLAERLDNVRVVTWPDRIDDDGAATDARRRSGGAIVIGGTDVGGIARVVVSARNVSGRVDDSPLERLAEFPTDFSVSITSTDADQIQAIALLALSHVYLSRGDRARARAVLTPVLSVGYPDQSARAMLSLYQGYIDLTARPPDLTSAIAELNDALGASDSADGHLDRGLAFVRADDPARWQSDLQQATALSPTDPTPELALCWAYALDRAPEQGLPHCASAIRENAPAESVQEPRAIAEMEQGQLSQAATDLQGFLTWLDSQPPELRARYGSGPADWLNVLQAGRNPFDEATLARLRRE